MAVITSQPKTHLIDTDRDFRELAKRGLLTELRTQVAKNTYPRSGMDHPTMAVDDYLEFVAKNTKHRLVVFSKEHIYRITGITLERDVNTFEWNWCIEFRGNNE